MFHTRTQTFLFRLGMAVETTIDYPERVTYPDSVFVFSESKVNIVNKFVFFVQSTNNLQFMTTVVTIRANCALTGYYYLVFFLNLTGI